MQAGREKLIVLVLFAALVFAPTAAAATCLKITVNETIAFEKVECTLGKPFKTDTNSIAKNYIEIKYGGIDWSVYFDNTVLIRGDAVSGLKYIRTGALRLTVKYIFFDNNDNSYSKGIMCWVRHPEEYWWRGGCGRIGKVLSRGVGGVFFVVNWNENKLGYNNNDVAYLEVFGGRNITVKIPRHLIMANYLVIGDVEKIVLKFRDEVGELHALRLYTSPQPPPQTTQTPAASLPSGHGQLLYAAAGAGAMLLLLVLASVLGGRRR